MWKNMSFNIIEVSVKVKFVGSHVYPSIITSGGLIHAPLLFFFVLLGGPNFQGPSCRF